MDSAYKFCVKKKLPYFIPTDELDTEGFIMTTTPWGLAIELAQVLTNGSVDYKTDKYSFIITPFSYQEGITGYELALTAKHAQPRAPYTGKPRGHKLKSK